jgi:hypothetical protein
MSTTNEELDRKIAEAQGFEVDTWASINDTAINISGDWQQYHPSTNWQQAGELIEKYVLRLERAPTGMWICRPNGCPTWSRADNPRRAICLAVLAAEGAK